MDSEMGTSRESGIYEFEETIPANVPMPPSRLRFNCVDEHSKHLK